MSITRFIEVLLCVFCSMSFAYATSIEGRIVDSGGAVVGADVYLEDSNYRTVTNATGLFRFRDIPQGDYTLVVEYDGELLTTKRVIVGSTPLDLGSITVGDQRPKVDASDIAVVTLDLDEESDTDYEGISSILTASRDPFVNAASFQFFPARYRVRGYGNADRRTYLNGFMVNDLDDGSVYWGTWGGLNDVFRAQESTLTLESMDYSMGGIGGAVNVDLRASSQRPQTKAVYNISNRSYTHRVMLTHSSGMNKNGWAYTLSGSRRWGQQGYIKGTYYDAWSYFGGVEKKINSNHSLGLTVLGAPTDRGRSSGSTQEMYDLTGNRYYNANWGLQNGKVRNSRAYQFHQPIGILRHDWKVNNTLNITTSLAYQTGYNGTTRLDWYNAPDPRPDYYRKLPSYQLTESGSEQVADYIRNNKDAQQINWHRLYNINKGRVVTIPNANGSGEAKTGGLAAYVIENQRYDNEKWAFNTRANAFVSEDITIDGGLQYNLEKVHNYKLLADLLGGEFYIDLDKFAERDFPSNTDAQQNDLRRPNRILSVGDRYGWDYDIVTSRTGGWLQGRANLSKVDIFGGLDFSHTSFYREGFVQNGKFPDSSLGKSQTQQFFNYTLKAGVTYKINGRNYLMANGRYQTRPPYSRHVYMSPRTRHQIMDNLTDEKIMSGEVSYVFKYPYISGKLTGYFTEFRDKIETANIYSDVDRSFGKYVLRGVNTRHQGIELGAQIKLSQTFNLSLAAGVGANQYSSRPTRFFTIDNKPQKTVASDTVYLKNYYLPGPQSAFSVTLNYNSSKYWFANISINHFRGIYLDVYPERRTNHAVSNIARPVQDDLFYKVIGQRKFNNQFTVNLFAGKSWKINDYYLFLYGSVGNLLNNRDFITGGFEQYRYDFKSHDVEKFQPRLFYMYGVNYQLGLSLRL